MSFHDEELAGSIHIIHNYEYANEAARLAATGFTANDVGKVAQQQSDKTYWILSDHSPITWKQLCSSGGITGDVIGPASATDGNIALFDGTTGKLIKNGPAPIVFGRDYQAAADATRSTTTSTTFQTKLQLVAPVLTGTYRIGWHAVVDQASVADAVQAQLYNVTDASVVGVIQEHEPKDSNNRISVGGFAEIVFSGAAKTFEIQYRQQRGGTAGIQDARIEIWRVA